MSKQSAVERKIAKARVQMLFDVPFWGYLSLNLDLVEDKGLVPPTIGTDGIHLVYYPDFVEKLPDEELKAVIAHELCHCFLLHMPRQQGREKARWNIAADYATNWLIHQEFKLPSCALLSEEFSKTAEWNYAHLPPQTGDQSAAGGQSSGGKSGSQSSQSQSGGGNSDQTLDSHEPWKNWGKKNGQNGQDKPNNASALEEAAQAIEALWKERLASAANAARMRGKLPANIEELVGKLLEPVLPWPQILASLMTSLGKNDYRILPPNKRYIHRGIYLPSIAGQELKAAVVIDSSGSISNEMATLYLSEVHGICDMFDDYELHLFMADAVVHAHHVIQPFDELPKVIVGRGGTSFIPAIEEASKLEVTSIVYFTDGNGTYPEEEPDIPVIWCMLEGYQQPPWGRVIEIPNETKRRRRI